MEKFMLQFASENRKGIGLPKIAHVYLDGEDVTNRCFAVDLETGFVGLFVQQDGKYVIESGRAKRTFKRGDVFATYSWN